MFFSKCSSTNRFIFLLARLPPSVVSTNVCAWSERYVSVSVWSSATMRGWKRIGVPLETHGGFSSRDIWRGPLCRLAAQAARTRRGQQTGGARWNGWRSVYVWFLLLPSSRVKFLPLLLLLWLCCYCCFVNIVRLVSRFVASGVVSAVSRYYYEVLF